MSNLARPGSAAYAALFRYALRMNSRYWKVLGESDYMNKVGVTFCFTGHVLDAVYSPVGDRMSASEPRADLKNLGPIGFFFRYRNWCQNDPPDYWEREDYHAY